MPRKNPVTWAKMVHFYKEIANNPQASYDELAKNVGISRSMAYSYLDELKTAWAVTSDDANFPRKLLLYHNHRLPAGTDPLTDDDIERLKPIVVGMINTKEAENEAIPISPEGMLNQDPYAYAYDSPKGDVGTNEGLLKTILLKMRYVSPGAIDRFLENYKLNEEDFERRPETLMNYMRHMFGPGQGQSAFEIFKTTQGKYVDAGMAGNTYNGGGMDPMMLMAMMGGGNMQAILPMLMQQGGGRMDPMMTMMISQMQQKQQQKQDQQDMMDKAMQIAMLKLVGGSMDDRNPMNPYMMGMGGMGMPGWQIQEVLDSNGKVTGRTLVPASPGMAGLQPQSNPIVEIVLKNALERETMLMQQNMNSSKPITDLFMSMIGNFKSNSDPVAQLGMLRQSFPELFERKSDPGSMNLDVYKLKFDTDLAMMAQQIELKKMNHTWQMEKLDRESQNESAKQWMGMIETFGDKLGAPIAGALIQGMGTGLGGAPGLGAPPGMMPNQANRVAPMQVVAPPPEEKKPDPLLQSIVATPNPGPDPAVLAVAVQQEQQTRQLQSVMLSMQQEIERLRSDNNKMNSKLTKSGQSQRVIDPNAVKKLPTSTLREALAEYNHQAERQEEIGKLLHTELANREMLGTPPEPEDDEEDEFEGEEEEIEPEDEDESEVAELDAEGALDDDDVAGPRDGVSTKPISSNDTGHMLDGDTTSLPSEIADHYSAYEKAAEDSEKAEEEED